MVGGVSQSDKTGHTVFDHTNSSILNPRISTSSPVIHVQPGAALGGSKAGGLPGAGVGAGSDGERTSGQREGRIRCSRRGPFVGVRGSERSFHLRALVGGLGGGGGDDEGERQRGEDHGAVEHLERAGAAVL